MSAQQEPLALQASSSSPYPSISMPPDQTRWQIIENQREPTDDHRDNQDPTGTYVRISTLTNEKKCKRTCRCQCHARKNLQSPQWLKGFLGMFFYSHPGVSFLRSRPCDYSNCVQREAASCQLTYFFPSWMVTSFIFSASYPSLGGRSASWSIGFPCTVSASHKAWMYIERRQSDELLQLLRQQLIGVNDLADDDGSSLLIVCGNHRLKRRTCANINFEVSLKYQCHDITRLLLDHGANPHLVDPRGV